MWKLQIVKEETVGDNHDVVTKKKHVCNLDPKIFKDPQGYVTQLDGYITQALTELNNEGD